MYDQSWEDWDIPKEPKAIKTLDEMNQKGELDFEDLDPVDSREIMDELDFKLREEFEDELKGLSFPEQIRLIKGVAEVNEDTGLYFHVNDYIELLDHIDTVEIDDEEYPVLNDTFVHNESMDRIISHALNEHYEKQIPDVIFDAYRKYKDELSYAQEIACENQER